MVVPHYSPGVAIREPRAIPRLTDKRLELLNGRFIRQLISSKRLMSTEDFFSTAHRRNSRRVLNFYRLSITQYSSDAATLAEAEQLIKRYSISYVDSRAVLLLDIVDFSLFSPFEQTTQLISLSYSLNSAYNKLLKINIKIDFARTTTGDGFYV